MPTTDEMSRDERRKSRTGEHFVLRISAAEGHRLAAQRSKMHWLMALRCETLQRRINQSDEILSHGPGPLPQANSLIWGF